METRNIISQPENEERKDDCRKEKNVKKFCDTTAGIVEMVR